VLLLIHDAVQSTGSFTNRTYGSAQAIAIDLGQTDVELTQELVNRLGVWRATPPGAIFGQPTLGAVLAEVSDRAYPAIGALLSALVWHKGSDDLGQGFYGHAQLHRMLRQRATRDAQLICPAGQVRAVLE
jgi:hypothetical protein